MRIVVAMILCGGVVVAGCGDNGNNNNSDAAVPADMAMAAVPSCTTYCSAVLANCTGAPMAADGGTVGEAPFGSMNACMHACALMPVGKVGDQSGNTLGCRTYHAMAAGGGGSAAATHCPHASMSGGGVCGDRCASFCALATAVCTAANGVTDPQFTSLADCMSQCGTAPFAFDTAEPEIVVDTPTLNCAFYHLGEAFSMPMATGGTAPDHCGDFRVTNPDRGCI
jgi:hypothetical protein